MTGVSMRTHALEQIMGMLNIKASLSGTRDYVRGVEDNGLWEHQKYAVKRAKMFDGFGIFFGMGAGKTRTALQIVHEEDRKRILVVMPKTLLEDGTWKRQIEQYLPDDPKTVVQLSGNDTTAKKALDIKRLKRGLEGYKQAHGVNMPERVFVLINYDSFWRGDLGKALLDFSWDCLIMDEAHRIKAAGTEVSRFAFRLTNAHGTAKRLALTGTPMPNSPLDLYGLYRFLDVRVFGSNYGVFSNHYAYVGGQSGHQVLGYKNLDELAKKMATCSVQVATDDVIELPDAVHIDRYADLEHSVAKAYAELERDFVLSIMDQESVVDNTLVKMLRMQQLTSGFVPVFDENTGKATGEALRVSTAKLDLFMDVVEAQPADHPGVVFCKFVYDIEQIHEALNKAGYSTAELSGRKREVDVWRAGKAQILVVQMQSGSEGIDLTLARWVVYFSKVHGYGTYEQSLARVRRPGQVHKTTFTHLLIRGTIDVMMEEALATKGETLQAILQIYKNL